MEWYFAAALALVALFVIMFSGIPLAVGLILLGIVGLSFYLGPDKALSLLGMSPFGEVTNFAWVAIPLFLFMAEIMLFTGINADLFEAIHKWVGRLPGGLAMSTVAACAAFGAVCGTSTANAVTNGVIAIPEMKKRGYANSLAAGVVAAGGGLGILIPPSLPLIFYGIITETSVGKLFMAGLIPGLLMAALDMTYIGIACARNPRLGPRIAARVSWKDRFFSLRKIWGIVVLIFLVLGTIYTGVATVSEAAGMGALGALILSIIYRKLNRSSLREAMVRTSQLSGTVIILVVGAIFFGYFMTVSQIPQNLAAFLVNLPVNRWVIMIGINILLIILGCVLEGAILILVILPILFPVVVTLGFDPVWFGVVFVVNMEIGTETPPIGLNLFVVKSICDIPIGDIMRGAIPFAVAETIVLILVMAFPQLSLWVPSLLR